MVSAEVYSLGMPNRYQHRKKMMKFQNISTAIFLVGALTLSGCSADSAATGCSTVTSGSVSDSVEVTGNFGESTTVTVGSAVTLDALQMTVITAGTGKIPEPGSEVVAVVSLFNGSPGDRINELRETLTVSDPNQSLPVRAGVDCLSIGTRSVTVFPANELYSEQVLDDVGLTLEQSLIQVIDIVEISTTTR